MNAVVGVSQLLSETQLTDEQRNFLEIIQGSATGLKRIIGEYSPFFSFNDY